MPAIRSFIPATNAEAVAGVNTVKGVTPAGLAAAIAAATGQPWGQPGPLLSPINIGSYAIPAGVNAAFIDNVTIGGTVSVPTGSTLVVLNGTAP